ncbi:MAG: hypothetical protein ACOY9Y_09825 [Bacillota bacterium]
MAPNEETKKIYYFSKEGKENLKRVIDIVREWVIDYGYNKVVVFTADGEGPLRLREAIPAEKAKVVAVSFPAGQVFRWKNEDGTIIEKTPKVSDPSIREAMEKSGITLARGPMPLEDILIPNVADPKTEAIKQTFRLFAGSMSLCVQAILMACDTGAISEGEDVIAMASDTAIVARSSSTRYMFHPSRGLIVREILCKPRHYDISRKG